MNGSSRGVRGRVDDKPIDEFKFSGKVVYPLIEGRVLFAVLPAGVVVVLVAVVGGVFPLLAVLSLLLPGDLRVPLRV